MSDWFFVDLERMVRPDFEHEHEWVATCYRDHVDGACPACDWRGWWPR